MVLTRGELRRREEAVVAGFVERNGDKAFAYVQELIKINANEGVLFRFRPPKEYEIDTLEAEQIFLCKPSIYEDTGDCEILYDIRDLCQYFMLEMKPEKYKRFSSMFDDAFYDEIMEKVKGKSAYEALREKIRDQALVACFSEKYEDYMWDEYASNSEGICLMYNLQEVFLAAGNELKFYPVRYVDNRRNQKDIWFTSREYNERDDYELAHLKFLLSCLTKERIPYSKEAEWRFFHDFASLDKSESGKKFDFHVKPRAVIMGKNIDNNSTFRDRVQNYATLAGIKLLKAQEIKK